METADEDTSDPFGNGICLGTLELVGFRSFRVLIKPHILIDTVRRARSAPFRGFEGFSPADSGTQHNCYGCERAMSSPHAIPKISLLFNTAVAWNSLAVIEIFAASHTDVLEDMYFFAHDPRLAIPASSRIPPDRYNVSSRPKVLVAVANS